MVKIRLSRRGAKKAPFYNIIVIDSRRKRDGRAIERVGFFNPNSAEHEIKLRIDTARVAYWLQNGGQLSERVKQLLKQYKRTVPAVSE